jgi:hypothetical protein
VSKAHKNETDSSGKDHRVQENEVKLLPEDWKNFRKTKHGLQENENTVHVQTKLEVLSIEILMSFFWHKYEKKIQKNEYFFHPKDLSS